MDLQEAINHCIEVANKYDAANRDCMLEHNKLADLFIELQNFRAEKDANLSKNMYGKWITKMKELKEDLFEVLTTCSQCGYLPTKLTNYCPNYGSKMDVD